MSHGGERTGAGRKWEEPSHPYRMLRFIALAAKQNGDIDDVYSNAITLTNECIERGDKTLLEITTEPKVLVRLRVNQIERLKTAQQRYYSSLCKGCENQGIDQKSYYDNRL